MRRCCSTELFGRECFLNEIVWAYDYGARPRRRWPAKHDTILVYVKDPEPLLVRRRGGRTRAVHGAGPRRRRRRRSGESSRPTSGGTRSSLPRGRRRPAIRPRSRRGCFAGSCRLRRGRTIGASTRSPARGRWGRSARQLGRRFVLVDSSSEAVEVARGRARAVSAARLRVPAVQGREPARTGRR